MINGTYRVNRKLTYSTMAYFKVYDVKKLRGNTYRASKSF